MNNPRKLTSRQQTAEQQLRQAVSQSGAREFGSAEEMLRHDALHTPLPPGIATRLARSVKGLQPPPSDRPWWKRLFGS